MGLAWRATLTATTALVLATLPLASSHGRLIEPPSRASAWRYGFATPHNYNDHELYCGGFARQWNKNGGNCGICGDAWDQKTPRPHELGGRFGQGVIVRKYLVNSIVSIKVELTANHNGYFEFRICSQHEDTTQECLDENVLRRFDDESGDGVQARFYPNKGNQIYNMTYKLPADLMCEHCVLQWKYVAGNNWGTCPNGTGLVGCGPQEEFRACADVAIGLTTDIDTVTTRTRPPYVFPTRRTTTSKPTNETDTEEFGPSAGDNVWIGVLISAIMLFIVLVALALLYFYYYRGGHRIKNLLNKKKLPPPTLPPVRPPRVKRTMTHIKTTPEFKTDIDNNLEPGFETIRLNDNSNEPC